MKQGMKAFLLSAGLGTRLRPLTNEIPKCLLPIRGKPLLEIWLELLSKHGVTDVLVNTHWQREKVVNFLEGEKIRKDEHRTSNVQHRTSNGKTKKVEEDGEKVRREEVRSQKTEIRGQRPKPNIKLFYEEELLGSAGTLLVNREWVADGRPFFILYGDNLTNVDLGRMYEFHVDHGMPFTLGVFKADEPERCGIAEVDEEGMVVGFVEKPEKPKSDLAAAGIYVADQRIFEYFPEGAEEMRPLDLGFHVIPRIVGHMKAYFIEEFLMDIGTVDSYEKAQIIWSKLDVSRKGAPVRSSGPTPVK